eukprot:scaffold56767_cov42-Attheya_sp.AAC.2
MASLEREATTSRLDSTPLARVESYNEVAGTSPAFILAAEPEPPARHWHNSRGRGRDTSLRLTRTEAADVMNTLLMPTAEYDD